MPEGITSVIIVGDASQKVESALIGRVDVRRIEDIEVPDAKVVANFGLNLLGTPELATPNAVFTSGRQTLLYQNKSRGLQASFLIHKV